ncbi:MAG: hypothetical protein II914_03975 [Clostridia bacterium]|nr:hypothetical protein [Clostridia bacterium]MBQ3815732.1 hypothetical protein [Clostridia bacterium]MBR0444383.1 hypothetical protein [Clostridia bacterium]
MYEREYRILSSDTDAARRLRLSRLFTFLQEASIAHTTELGMGREKTLDRGLLWIVTLQQADVVRLPVYDERVKLFSWPGDTMHLLFPRFYRVEDESGETLVSASAFWALMDSSTRRIVFPEEHGIGIAGERTGKEPPLPAAPRSPKDGETERFAVPYSYVDLNGHMNNTRYFDLAEDRMDAELRSKTVKRIRAEYSREARLSDEITLKSERTDESFLIAGESGGRKLFKLDLTYGKD